MTAVDELIDGWLDGSLADADVARLEAALGDPVAVKRLVLAAHLERSLRVLARVPARAATSRTAGLRAQLGPRRRPAWRRRVVAAAALALVAIGATAIAVAPARGDRPRLDGRDLPGGSVVRASDGPVALAWADGTRVELARDGVLVVEAGPGKRLRLDAGAVDASVAIQPSDLPLRLAAGDVETVAAGTAFRCERAPDGVVVAVADGSARLARRGDGFAAALGAGDCCTLPATGAPWIDRGVGAAIVLDDDEAPAVRSVLADASSAIEMGEVPGLSGPTAIGVRFALGAPPDEAHWAILRLRPQVRAWDLSGSDGIECRLWCPLAGRPVWIEACGYGPDLREDRFVAIATAATAGWQLVRVPWSAFVRRTPWQPTGAPGRELDPAHLAMLHLTVIDRGPIAFAVDRVAAWRPAPR